MRTEPIVLIALALVLLAMTACAPAPGNGIVIERVASYQVPLDAIPQLGAFPLPSRKPTVY